MKLINFEKIVILRLYSLESPLRDSSITTIVKNPIFPKKLWKKNQHNPCIRHQLRKLARMGADVNGGDDKVAEEQKKTQQKKQKKKRRNEWNSWRRAWRCCRERRRRRRPVTLIYRRVSTSGAPHLPLENAVHSTKKWQKMCHFVTLSEWIAVFITSQYLTHYHR